MHQGITTLTYVHNGGNSTGHNGNAPAWLAITIIVVAAVGMLVMLLLRRRR